VQLPVPDFNGTLRVSALVYADERYGNRDAETVVRAPILAEASMPRVMAPGDRSTVTLDVQNFTGKPGEFAVRVEGVGPLAIGEGSRSVKLGVDGKTTLNFPLAAQEGYTVAKVRVRVEGNGFKADRSYDLPVRAAWPSVLRAQTRVVDPIAPVAFDAGLAEGLMSGSVNARMVVSALPPIPFASALKGALDYPYGCAEQTTSRATPRCCSTTPPPACSAARGWRPTGAASAWKARSAGWPRCRFPAATSRCGATTATSIRR
jgi:uncharacterized protein YfaS (alpha-2-macroglobulin family)